MRINEIFYSLQGEGVLIGTPTIFIRTSGCNLRCKWCDTEYAREDYKTMTPDDIVREVKNYSSNHICITGGEPLIQNNMGLLIRLLLNRGYHISIETNGTVPIRNLVPTPRLSIHMDVKCPSSGETDRLLAENLRLLSEPDQLKFVISGQADYEYAKCILAKHRPRCPIIFQPVWGTDIKWLAETVLRDRLNVRVLPQLHKYVWGAGERGV